jgi:hypothetical protein
MVCRMSDKEKPRFPASILDENSPKTNKATLKNPA